MGAPEVSRTSTPASVSNPARTNPGGTGPAGKLIRVAKIWGGAAEEELPPPPPLQAASSRQAAAALARAPSLLWDGMNSLPGPRRPLVQRPRRSAPAPLLSFSRHSCSAHFRWNVAI